ncbi:MAG: phosphoribosylformylglycinamidine cyclo-ligase, partial [Candidatus Cloacimonadaceae bacterium]
CVNDILVQGAIPQFFLDYIGVGKLEPDTIEKIIDGFVIACRQNSCALIGGEMAEMPGLYKEKDFDLAGTIVGMVEADQLLPRAGVAAGDALLALPSTGLHTNGYSLARKVLFERMGLRVDSYMSELGESLGEALLKVHKSYLNELKPYLTNPKLKALAHITGGGIGGNLARVLPAGVQAEIQLKDSEIPPLFQIIQKGGNVQPDVMRQSFNLGIGMIIVCDQSLAGQISSEIGTRYLGRLVKQEDTAKVIFV